MKDNRTEDEKYAAWVAAVNACHARGWQCICGWIFKAPSGTLHDLSAACMSKLDLIEKLNLFTTKGETQHT